MSDSIENLIDGYREFRKKYFQEDRELFRQLAEQGQNPKFLVIACSDSRVDPSIVFNCKPGDLFVVRNVASLVPPYEGDRSYHGTSAAIEFAVRFLNIQDIVILGHSQCGGIGALMEESVDPDSFIGRWIQLAKPARERVIREHGDASNEDKRLLCAEYALQDSLKNLGSFPWIADKLKAGQISFHGWYFDITHGTLHTFDPGKDGFSLLETDR